MNSEFYRSFTSALSFIFASIFLITIISFAKAGFPEGRISIELVYSVVCYFLSQILIAIVLTYPDFSLKPDRSKVLNLLSSSFFLYTLMLATFSPLIFNSVINFILKFRIELSYIAQASCISSFIVTSIIIFMHSLITLSEASSRSRRFDLSPLLFSLMIASSSYIIAHFMLSNPSWTKISYNIVYGIPATLTYILSWVGLLEEISCLKKSRLWILLSFFASFTAFLIKLMR